MNASFKKRFTAFIIDLVIVTLINVIISSIIPLSKNYNKLNDKATKIVENYQSKIINEDNETINVGVLKEYFNEVTPISYQMEKETFLNKIVSLIICILYYVVFQFKKEGQTIGKKAMKIKVIKQKDELTINDLIFRSFIVNSLLSSLICIILLFTTKNMTYLISTEIITSIFDIIILISGIMCIARKDNKTLQDIITKTEVVEMGE